MLPIFGIGVGSLLDYVLPSFFKSEICIKSSNPVL